MLPFISILRPLNLLQATLAVILTTALLDELSQLNTLLLLILSVITINGAGNIINDIYDLEIDRVNQPDRVLPAAKMSVPTARIYMFSLFSLGIILAACISLPTFVIAGLIATPTLIAYSIWLKRLPLIGNITVSFMLGLAFIYVGSAFGNIPFTLLMAALAFGFTLIRELVKDMEDMAGDATQDAHTLPLVWGTEPTIRFIVLLIMIFIILDLTPYLFGVYNDLYLWIVALGINLPLLYCILVLWRYPSTKNYHHIQIFLKLNIFVGLTALYFGRSL